MRLFLKKKIANFEPKYLGTGKSKTCQVCVYLKALFKIYLFSVPEFWFRSLKKATAAEKISPERPKFGLAALKELIMPYGQIFNEQTYFQASLVMKYLRLS